MEIDKEQIASFVAANVKTLFHDKRAASLESIKLRGILKRKNPYLFKAKNIVTADAMVKTILDAFLSSQEETIFGQFLEELAIYVCGLAFSGRKSSTEGIDLEFVRDGVVYLVAIKSGPNWGNASQIARMKDDFRRAKVRLNQNSGGQKFIFVNGCCYGVDRKPDKGDYLKLCGQRFWELVSGDETLYVDLIEPLGRDAKVRNDEFLVSYATVLNKFTQEFLNEFSTDGQIDWERIVALSSPA